ncbi:metal-dependent hydrolase [Photobacterium damselae]|uniref:metal-dependent hydrolase n=1 Tax=Photobacterium damselae TaxID=38293 RepID=UPI000D660FEA|nr:metal-dependent hydrolase [Photobacterium damselae]AWK84510.1 hypothetical protein BST98_20980 [Photobacterium damselae]
MLGRNHILFGCSGWLVASKLLPYIPDMQTTVGAFALPIVAVGALLPDLDCPNSLLGRRLPFISKPLAALQGDYTNGHAFKHSRGVTHTIWLWLALYYFMFGFQPVLASLSVSMIYVVALLFGWGSHILGDMFTTNGVRVFWPIPTIVRMPFYFQTGSITEYIFTLSITGAGVLYYFGYQY